MRPVSYRISGKNSSGAEAARIAATLRADELAPIG